jgi:hypothetical protein
MTDGDLTNFRAVFDELTDEVNRATYQFLPDHIANWFKTLDTTPRVAAIYSTFLKPCAGGVFFPNARQQEAHCASF